VHLPLQSDVAHFSILQVRVLCELLNSKTTAQNEALKREKNVLKSEKGKNVARKEYSLITNRGNEKTKTTEDGARILITRASTIG